MKRLIHALTILGMMIFVLDLKAADFPATPHLLVTPGKLCDRPVKKRYPEGIDYCERDVNFIQKEAIILMYDQKFGYKISSMERLDFKLDHFIPLCAGGSNDNENLWPQHKSIYLETDPVEPLICEKMALGLLKQKDAVILIQDLKTRRKKASQVLAVLKKVK